MQYFQLNLTNKLLIGRILKKSESRDKMLKQIKIDKGVKLLSVVLATLMGGFMWRCRGESGFGSSWGLYSVGIIFMLIIYCVYGQRKNMKFELIPLGAFFLGLGVTGYATVFDQTAGVLAAYNPYQGVDNVYWPVNPVNGTLIFFIMGLTLVPFFSFFIGTLFSDKEYKLGHYLGAIAVFFVVSNICKATIAHPLISIITPDAVKAAEAGLADSGFDYVSAAKAYMAHFLDRDWADDIPFFENYYMSVEHVSDLFGAICLGFYPLIIKKDKLPLITSFVINVGTAIGTTAFSVIYSMNFNTGFFANVTPLRIVRAGSGAVLTLTEFPNGVKAYIMEGGSGWGIWEYATGACVGFVVLLLIALLPKKYSSMNDIDTEPFIKNKVVSLIYNIITVIFIFALTPMRAVGLRIGKLLYNEGILEDDSPTGDIIMIALTVILGVFFIVKLVKNIMKLDTTPLGVNPLEFSKTALPAYFAMCAVLYFFTNHAPLIHLPFEKLMSASGFSGFFFGWEGFEIFLMLVTLIAVVALLIPFFKKIFPKQK